MKIVPLHQSSARAPRLLLIFAGWGMDANPFRNLKPNGYDIAVAYDYRETDFTEAEELCSGYEEILVVAWSFGTPAAAEFVRRNESRLPVSRCIAVNGTLYPSHDTLGIPKEVFNLTLNNISPSAMQKFYRRMCGSEDLLREFLSSMPERDTSELKEELQSIALREWEGNPPFDRSYISLRDRIIPPQNQKSCWEKHNVETVEIAGGHMPDFNDILNREIIDKERVERSFNSALETYDSRATVQHLVARRLLERWKEFAELPTHGEILEFGVGSGFYTRLLRNSLSDDVKLRLWDLAPASSEVEQRDAETAIADLTPGSLAAMTSSSTVQWFNSFPRFLKRCVKSLAPGGVAAFSTYGPETYREIAPFQKNRLHYFDADTLRLRLEEMKQQGLIREYYVGEEITTLDFLTPRDLIAHLRESGVNATQSPDLRGALAMVRASLKRLTYQPLYLLLKV